MAGTRWLSPRWSLTLLRADLPGLDEKDLEVSVEGGALSIRGQREEEHEAKEDDYYYAERWAGSFARTITLPPGIDAEKIKATFRKGVLEIHIPKTQQAIGKRIPELPRLSPSASGRRRSCYSTSTCPAFWTDARSFRPSTTPCR
jgi:Hsp20/alpha crystallin family